MHIYFCFFMPIFFLILFLLIRVWMVGVCVGGWVRVKLDPKSKNISRILHLETVSHSFNALFISSHILHSSFSTKAEHSV
jgi:hypothetical protein